MTKNSELDFEVWQLAIGKLIMACSRVEYELLKFYELRLPERSYLNDSYLDRFDKAIGISKRIFDPKTGMVEGLIQMRKIAKYRHIVAHNPVHYSNDTGNWHIFDLKTEEDSVTLNDLVFISEEAELTSIRVAAGLRIYS